VWRKSRHSGTEQGACVELAALDAAVGIRDSQKPSLGHLAVSREDLAGLLGRIKAGELDL
jgi:xanthine/CO dehydrogenase XdhC/CoxF family maturation factor